MARTLAEKMAALPAARRQKVQARIDELIAEEMSLRDLRKAMQLTQKHIAKQLGIGQEGVSRLEQRSDLMISTLRNYVEALGGELHFIAEFPDRAPVMLSGLASVQGERRGRRSGKIGRKRGTLR